jgi:hypothetical protein
VILVTLPYTQEVEMASTPTTEKIIVILNLVAAILILIAAVLAVVATG